MTFKLNILLMLLSTAAIAQDVPAPNSDMWSSGTSFVIDPAIKPSLVINMGSTDAYVTFHPDGSIEYGKNYTPDAAAKALWDAMGVERKARNCQ